MPRHQEQQSGNLKSLQKAPVVLSTMHQSLLRKGNWAKSNLDHEPMFHVRGKLRLTSSTDSFIQINK